MDQGSEAKPGRKNRPYWHVDAKWVSGLIGLAAITATLLSFTLFRLTSEKHAVPLAASALEAAFSPPRESDQDTLTSLREEIQASDQDVFYPFPGIDVGVTADDLESQSVDQIRDRLFTGLAEEIYWSGSEASPGPQAEGIWEEYGFMAIMTHKTHRLLRNMLWVSAGLSLLSLMSMSFFSHEAGKLASPGCALVLAGIPGFVFTSMLLSGTGDPQFIASGASETRLSGIALALSPALDIARQSYLWPTVGGVSLLLAAVLVKVSQRLFGGREED
ncbi:MAG: hypothetical protein R3191_07450 [Anaerolineales bacterium]|nr:hypothetical protein [Anaerolineales bacterium]